MIIDIELQIKELYENNVHYGHKRRFNHSSTSKYIDHYDNDMAIINMNITKLMFERALSEVDKIISQGGTILLVGTKIVKKWKTNYIAQYAQQCNMPYVDKRWLGGTFTNFEVLNNNISKLQSMRKVVDSNYSFATKKERINYLRELAKMEGYYQGLMKLEGKLPQAIFIIDAKYEQTAVSEAIAQGIKIIAITDTNNNLKGIDFPIVGNDDSYKAIEFYLRSLSYVINSAQLIVDLNQKIKDCLTNLGDPTTNLES